jgi:hypothetical protein
VHPRRKILGVSAVLETTFRVIRGIAKEEDMSDQERDKYGDHEDEDATEDVEAHKHGHRDADPSADDSSDDVVAHKLGAKDS